MDSLLDFPSGLGLKSNLRMAVDPCAMRIHPGKLGRRTIRESVNPIRSPLIVSGLLCIGKPPRAARFWPQAGSAEPHPNSPLTASLSAVCAKSRL